MARVLRGRSFYGLLLLLAALVNAAGYLFSLWHDETVFDEVVHVFTSFAVLSSLGRRLITEGLRPSIKLVASLLVLALALGVAWELFEWVVGIVGNARDTVLDLVMDVVGGAFAAALLSSVFGKDRRS